MIKKWSVSLSATSIKGYKWGVVEGGGGVALAPLVDLIISVHKAAIESSQAKPRQIYS